MVCCSLRSSSRKYPCVRRRRITPPPSDCAHRRGVRGPAARQGRHPFPPELQREGRPRGRGRAPLKTHLGTSSKGRSYLSSLLFHLLGPRQSGETWCPEADK